MLLKLYLLGAFVSLGLCLVNLCADLVNRLIWNFSLKGRNLKSLGLGQNRFGYLVEEKEATSTLIIFYAFTAILAFVLSWIQVVWSIISYIAIAFNLALNFFKRKPEKLVELEYRLCNVDFTNSPKKVRKIINEMNLFLDPTTKQLYDQTNDDEDDIA